MEKINLPPVKKLIISGNRHQESSLEDVLSLFPMLRRFDIEFRVERRFADYLRNLHADIRPEEIIEHPSADADAALSLGGDGTFLRTARWIGRTEIPVLGINTGHLGFLASHNPADMEQIIKMLLSGEGVVENRMALSIDVNDPEAKLPELPYALNEVAILKDDTSSMINVHVDVEGHYLGDYLSDGLIISTPTGSTAYSLSAGGPILSPTIDALCITPIAAHTLTFRPFVVGGDAMIKTLTTTRASHYRVSLDGVSFLMREGTCVSIHKADFTPKILRAPEDTFTDTLRNKLLWGMR